MTKCTDFVIHALNKRRISGNVCALEWLIGNKVHIELIIIPSNEYDTERVYYDPMRSNIPSEGYNAGCDHVICHSVQYNGSGRICND